jgi:hypothetical protein
VLDLIEPACRGLIDHLQLSTATHARGSTPA